MLTIQEIQERAYANACAKGWHEKPVRVPVKVHGFTISDGVKVGAPHAIDHDRVLRMHALMHTELTEVRQALRDGRLAMYTTDNGKPEGAVVEIADFVIRVCDTTQALGVELAYDMPDHITRLVAVRYKLRSAELPDAIESVREQVDHASEYVRVDNWTEYSHCMTVALLCTSRLVCGIGQGPHFAAAIEAKMRYNETRPYTLYCVDRGTRVDEERQYLGPFATHAEAHENAEDDDLVRRCRQLRPSEIDFNRDAADLADFEVFDALVDELDQAACEGNLPEGAWYRIGDRVVSSKYDDGTLPTHRDFDTWVDDRLVCEAWICEGDE